MGALPAQLSDTLGAHYGITPFDAKPLPGGWDRHAESWLVRSELGVLVVRADRSLTLASADWLGEVLEAARRRGVPVSAPLRTRDGAAGAALRDAAVTVRRYIEGRRVDRDRLEEAATAATVLARSHEALRGFDRPRPDRSLWHPVLWPAGNDPEPLRDLALDSFEAAFAADSRFTDTVIHGDYWADNLTVANRFGGGIDWSEARHDKAVR